MCTYFNPDCSWCEEYEAKTAICAKLGKPSKSNSKQATPKRWLFYF